MSKTIPVKLPDEMLFEIDSRIKDGRYLSRSDFLRYSARFMLEIDNGLIDSLARLRGRIKTAKSVRSMKDEAESEADKEVGRKLRRIGNAAR